MAAPTIVTIPKDTWTLVLSSVRAIGKVTIIDQANEPTKYMATYVDADDPAPLATFLDGIPFLRSVSPSNRTAIDIYIRTDTYDGKVEISGK